MAFENVIHLDSLSYARVGEGEDLGQVAELSSVVGTWHLGFHAEIVEPHAFSCPYHFHHAEEELFLVLEGRATLRQDGAYRHVGPGDLIFSGLGAKYVHQFYNHTDKPFRFLALSSRAQWDVCEYPDSGKLNVRGLRRVFKLDSQVEYREGETTPREFWPDAVLAGELPAE